MDIIWQKYDTLVLDPMDYDIRFLTASDNTHLAFARVWRGPPLVKVGNWLSHLEHGWNICVDFLPDRFEHSGFK